MTESMTADQIIAALDRENGELMRMVLDARGREYTAEAFVDLIEEVQERMAAREAVAQEAARQARRAWTPAEIV